MFIKYVITSPGGNPSVQVQARIQYIAKVMELALKVEINKLRNRAKTHVAGVLGNRIGNTWRRPKVFTGNPNNFNMRAYFSSKVPHIIRTFEEGARIGPKNRSALAIPLSGITRGRGAFQRKKLTPANYEAVYGVKLQAVRVGNRVFLRDPNSSRRNIKGVSKIVHKTTKKQPKGAFVFVLVKGVSISKRLSLRVLEREANEAAVKAISAALSDPVEFRKSA